MNRNTLIKKFNRMGAEVVFDESTRNLGSSTSIDIRDVKGKETFTLITPDGVREEISVISEDPKDRHLLLMIKNLNDRSKSKYLCGHDERHWFVAAVPESSSAKDVTSAKEALKPQEVLISQSKRGVKTKNRNRRKNSGSVRQGEWFFVPVDNLEVNPHLILKNEPIQRGNGSPHIVEELYRTSATTLMANDRNPNGISLEAYAQLKRENPDEAKLGGWRTVDDVSSAKVYARGKIKHRDHATINLQGWHEVFMNTENKSRAMRNVRFLD